MFSTVSITAGLYMFNKVSSTAILYMFNTVSSTAFLYMVSTISSTAVLYIFIITLLMFVLAGWSVSSFYLISVTVKNRTHVHMNVFCLESHILSIHNLLQIPPESPCMEMNRVGIVFGNRCTY